MSAKLFVGGLPFTFSNEEFRSLFAEAGKVVSAEMVHDPDRGRTRGFGFVEMGSDAEAQKAIETLNGRKIGEKNIYVTIARERPVKPPKPGAPPGLTTRPPFNRKVGRGPREPGQGMAPRSDGFQNRPSWPPRPDRPPRSDRPAYGSEGRPERTPGAFGQHRKGPPRGRRWDPRDPRSAGPASSGPGGPPRGRSSPAGGPPRSGFSRPNKWEPRGDDKRSFSAPPGNRGDFGPGDRRPSRPFGKPPRRPSGPPSDRPSSDRPPKKEFWKKFEKKKP